MMARGIVRCVMLSLTLGPFCYFVYYGTGGIRETGLLQKALLVRQEEERAEQCEIASIQERLAAWKQDDFMLEKVAREELLLGRAGEVVYHVS